MRLPTPPITWKKLTSKATRQKVLGWLLVAALAVCAICGAVALAKAIDSDTRKVHTNWERGNLDGTGQYITSKETIYTKNAFECAGLQINLDFDSEIQYEIVFYDENGTFLTRTDKHTGVFEFDAEDEALANAYYCRVVVTPTNDASISMLEVFEYSGQINISVLK